MLSLARVTRFITQRPFTSVVTLSAFAAVVSRPYNLTSTLGSSSSSHRNMSSDSASRSVQKSEDEWRAVLSKEQFRVLRQQGTEMAGTGEYDRHYPTDGVYACAGCGTPLYKAEHKFKSGCGWPAYHSSIPGAIERHEDVSFGMKRIEIVCKACGGHLVNSVSLKFQEGDAPIQAEGDAKAKA